MLTARLDLTDVDAGFRAISLRAKQLRPVLNRFRQILKGDLKEHFAQSENPDGSQWAPLAASTQQKILARTKTTKTGKRKSKFLTARGKLTVSGSKALNRRLGRLRTGFKLKVFQQMIRGVNVVNWSAAHDEGDRVGHGSQLPARHFAWISDEVRDLFRDKLQKHLIGAW